MSSSSPAQEERRPTAIVVVYTLDVLLAIAAFLGALGAFAGGASVGGHDVAVGVGEQVLAGLSAASIAALYVIVATLLTRPQRWVRLAQMAIFAAVIVIGGLSLLLEAVLPGHGVDGQSALSSLAFFIVSAIALFSFTGARVVAWYSERTGRAPWWVSGTLGFWVVSSLALTLIQALR